MSRWYKSLKNKIEDIDNGDYELLTPQSEYKNSKSKISIKHSCGRVFDVVAEYFTRKHKPVRCPCKNPLYMDNEIFLDKLYDQVKDEYYAMEEYIDSKTPILMKHNICGHEWKVKPSNFLSNKTRCPICSRDEMRLSSEEFLERVNNEVGENYIFLEDYKGYNKHISCKHVSCGHIWNVTPNNFLRKGTRCPVCQHPNSRKITDDYKEEVYNLTNGEYSVMDEYIDNKTPILMKHNTCGHEWEVAPNNFLSINTRCPKCGKYRKEYEIYNYLRTFVNEDIILNDRDILDGKELDIYIPELNLAIEFNGLYWHSDKFKDKHYHIDKTNKCSEQGIQLIHIMEDEWDNKKDIVKSKLKHILNYNNNPRVYARNCYIEKVSKKNKKNFLNANHIQGNDRSSIELGLYRKKDDKLVSVMTFCKSRLGIGFSNNENDYELSRFASDINYLVVGGYSKLLKYFLNNYKYNKITTYADLRWSNIDDNMYNRYFKLSHITEPNYWYADKENRYHRFNYRKGNLKNIYPEFYNEDLTEFEIMDKTNMYRIYDCGVATYEIEKQLS